MNRLIKIGDGYVPLSDYMAELREMINDDPEVVKAQLMKTNRINVYYKGSIKAILYYAGSTINMMAWWNEVGDNMPRDKRNYYATIYNHTELVAYTTLRNIRHYAQELEQAKERANEQAN